MSRTRWLARIARAPRRRPLTMNGPSPRLSAAEVNHRRKRLPVRRTWRSRGGCWSKSGRSSSGRWMGRAVGCAGSWIAETRAAAPPEAGAPTICSTPVRSLTNTTRLPLLENAGSESTAGSAVTCTTARLRRSRTRMSVVPVSSVTYASRRPSGAHEGLDSDAGELVTFSGRPPRVRTTKRSPPAENAIRFPPGDQAGSSPRASVRPSTPSARRRTIDPFRSTASRRPSGAQVGEASSSSVTVRRPRFVPSASAT